MSWLLAPADHTQHLDHRVTVHYSRTDLTKCPFAWNVTVVYLMKTEDYVISSKLYFKHEIKTSHAQCIREC